MPCAEATDGDMGNASGIDSLSCAFRACRAMMPAGCAWTEFLRHFVLAAAAADRRFARTQDARDIHAGITVWESLVDAGGLGESAPGVAGRRAARGVDALRPPLRGRPGRGRPRAGPALPRGRARARPAGFVCGPPGADVGGRVADAALPGRARARGPRPRDRDLDRADRDRRGRAGGRQPRSRAARPPRARRRPGRPARRPLAARVWRRRRCRPITRPAPTSSSR